MTTTSEPTVAAPTDSDRIAIAAEVRTTRLTRRLPSLRRLTIRGIEPAA